MASRNFSRYRNKPPLAEMNVVPLVDVMLVLLVIFIEARRCSQVAETKVACKRVNN
jgi:biopolymer transport protein ExbD